MIVMDIEVESCIRGHHVYSTIWTPVLEELLNCKRVAKIDMLLAICQVKDTVIEAHVKWKNFATKNLRMANKT